MKNEPHVTVANRISERLNASHTHGQFWTGSYYLTLGEFQIRVSDHSDSGSGGYSHNRSMANGYVDPYHSRSDVSVIINGNSRIEHISEEFPKDFVQAIEDEIVASETRRARANKAAATRKANRIAKWVKNHEGVKVADLGPSQITIEAEQVQLRSANYKLAVDVLGSDHNLVLKNNTLESRIANLKGNSNKRKRKNLKIERNRVQRKVIESAHL